MSAADRLTRKAREYEVMAASHEERAGVERRTEHVAAATAFTVAAIVLREVASALDEEREAA